ncbi:hypothetical protein BJ170DRAFT_287811 [Xylariales sp. AK1849]|nr:hypothetical protein BJ170DRAFT_287811 [Xylariales sp. AK1849]
MSGIIQKMTGWAHSPAPKSVNGESSDNTRRGVKRKADLYEPDEEEEDDDVLKTTDTQRVRPRVSSEPIETDAEKLLVTALEEGRNDEADGVHEVEKLLKHRRLSDDSVEILVQWADEAEEDGTYEPEEEIQRGAAETLYNYWKQQGGRTETLFLEGKNPSPEVYHVFKILRHKKEKTVFEFEVQWVGYPATPGSTSWETEAKMKKIALEMLDEYWESKGGRSKFLAKRGRAKKARTE